MSDEAWTSSRILHLLYERHAAKEGWACFAELANGTGTRASRSFDLFAIHTWPSKGYLRVAYEIKVSRSDFKRELEDPKKRGAAEEFANECWFAMPAGIVKPDEVPEGWGLVEATAGGLRRVKLPTQRPGGELPIHFVAALLRRGADEAPPAPALAWDFAGRAVGLADLRRLCEKLTLVPSGEAYRRGFDAGRDQWVQSRASSDTRDAEHRKVITEVLGHGAAWNPHTLRKKLAELGQGDAVPMQQRRELAEHARAILAVLDR